VQEILSRFPPTEFDVQAIYSKARYRGTFDMRELRDFYKALTEGQGTEPSASDFLRHVEDQAVEQEEALRVPIKGPIIIVGRPESYAGYHMEPAPEFRKLVEASGFPSRFSFLSDEPVDERDKTKENPAYRIIQDQRTGSEYCHEQRPAEKPTEIQDYAVIFATRLRKPFHTHGRLLTIVAGSSTIGTLGAAKLLMDSEELLKACPELRKPVRWPAELLLEVHVKFQGNAMDDVWDVSIKDVKLRLPVSMGFAPRQKSPGQILKELNEKANEGRNDIDYTEHWHPPGLPLAAQLVGEPRGRVDEFVSQLRELARDTYPVLILGESGVGKEIAARLFFVFNALWRTTTDDGWVKTRNAFRRREGQLQAQGTSGRSKAGKDQATDRMFAGLPRVGDMFFVDVNCGALPPDLIHSELFGHVIGAFTGAERDRAGAFLSAGSGTLFLDEIHTLSVEHQAAFLRALQEREVKPAGLDWTLAYGCNVVAASNENLKRLIRRGHFRGDLFNRFRSVVVIPPLNERLEDVLVHAVQVLFERSRTDSGKAFCVRMTERFIRLLLAQDFRKRNFRWLASLVTVADSKRGTGKGVPVLRGEFLPEDLGSQLPDKVEGKEIGFLASFSDGSGFDFRSLPALFMKPATEKDKPVFTLDSNTVGQLVTQVHTWLDVLRESGVLGDRREPCKICSKPCRSCNPRAPVLWYLRELSKAQGWKVCGLSLKSQLAKAWAELILDLYHSLDLTYEEWGDLFGKDRDRMSSLVREAHRTLGLTKKWSARRDLTDISQRDEPSRLTDKRLLYGRQLNAPIYLYFRSKTRWGLFVISY
jgi:hypothetical protein